MGINAGLHTNVKHANPPSMVPSPLCVEERGAYPKSSQAGQMAKTPVIIKTLLEWLADYPDRQAADYLAKGFTEGFRLHYEGDCVSIHGPNLRSVNQYPHEVKKADTRGTQGWEN